MIERNVDERLGGKERLQQVAIIFAAGILRLRRRTALDSNITVKNLAKTSASCLEVSRETVLSVHSG